MEAKKVLIIVGTRPEGIKMMPVYFALKRHGIPTLLVSTGQHTDLLHEVFTIFKVKPDIDLALGKPNQDLSYLTHAVLTACADLYKKVDPSLVLVQGDTTTIMAAALAAFYQQIPVGHVEAGLRTGDMYAPFPEELNRRVVSLFAQYHFAPSRYAVEHLSAEKIPHYKIHETGNTVVDALHYMLDQIERGMLQPTAAIQELVVAAKNEQRNVVLFTAHRRESFGKGLVSIMSAVQELAVTNSKLSIIFPVHPNPAVKEAIIQSGLNEVANISLQRPVSYVDLVYLLSQADLVLTDSGGIQEEAVSLGKPVLILREKTERPEGIWVGLAELVGSDKATIMTMAERFLQGKNIGHSPCMAYGDGKAAERIASIISTAHTLESTQKGTSCKNV